MIPFVSLPIHTLAHKAQHNWTSVLWIYCRAYDEKNESFISRIVHILRKEKDCEVYSNLHPTVAITLHYGIHNMCVVLEPSKRNCFVLTYCIKVSAKCISVDLKSMLNHRQTSRKCCKTDSDLLGPHDHQGVFGT